MEKKLEIVDTIKEGCIVGVKNFLQLLIAVVLYVLTVWIPYLNVGTTIGMYKLIIQLSKGQMADPLSIFDKENFEKIADFFLLSGLKTAGTTAALAFMFIPAVVIGIAWNFAVYLLIDKNTSPLKSLSLSYNITFGEKWRIFGIEAVFCILISLVTGLFGAIPKVGWVFSLIIALLACAIYVAIIAVMYAHFAGKADAVLAVPACCCEAAPEAEPIEEPAAEEPVAEEPEK